MYEEWKICRRVTTTVIAHRRHADLHSVAHPRASTDARLGVAVAVGGDTEHVNMLKCGGDAL
jgi:hypothetical protein